MNNRTFKTRLLWTAAIAAAAITGLGFRLAFLHLGDQKPTSRAYKEKLIAGRGNICDRNGRSNILAMNLVVKDICVNPSAVTKNDRLIETASVLSERLGMDAEQVAWNIKSRSESKFAYVKRFVPSEQASEIEQLKLKYVHFEEDIIRYYPHRSFMCHLLGFVNHEGVGSSGVELKVDKYLKGSHGRIVSKQDANQHELYRCRDDHVPAKKGSNVELTVDQNVQYIVEKALDEVMVEHNAKAAWAAVQRVKTGEILAMASRPAFDPNEFNKVKADERMNRVIGCNYEPGSTMKAVVFSAALNEGAVKTNTMINCENGSWMYARKPLRDCHGYGMLSFSDCLKKSSNIASAKLALMLGKNTLYSYLTAFGMGSRTGVDLPGEEAGILHPVKKWTKISPTRLAIGQGVSATSLQILNLYCTIANDGVRMKPYVVKSISSPDGEAVYRGKPRMVGRPITEETASTMKKLLFNVTEDGGTGRRARVAGYEIAGKTGTAQKVIDGAYSTTAYVGSFVGFIPAGDPEIGIIVVVDEPQPYHTGGVVAGPAFKKIAEQTVRCLDVEPSRYSFAKRD
ncbi:hypothetical protein BVX94_02715 [bacterium B17]|nr:hypothetical protein BVX94_02715 [bacterium B17]